MNAKSIIVQKYGGSSVATTDNIKKVARLIRDKRAQGYRLCVVVSAMGKTTDQLLKQAHEITQNPSRRELDMLLSCGERASMALLSMALEELGVPSISLTGSQSGIITNDVHSGAQIVEVRPYRVMQALDADKVVIVAGFQGVSIHREITTLGRGGSDTTAVALAAAVSAEACEIYSDVAGVLTADPRIVSHAEKLDTVSVDEMYDLALFGAKVLNQKAVLFAKEAGIKLYSRQTGNIDAGTLISSEELSKKESPTAIAHQENVMLVAFLGLEELGQLMATFKKAQIEVMQLIMVPLCSDKGMCLVAPEDAHGLKKAMAQAKTGELVDNLGTVSVVGKYPQKYMVQSVSLLNEFDIKGMWTCANRLSFLVPSQQVKSLTQHLHAHLMEGKIFQSA